MAAGKAKRSDKAIWQTHCHCSLVWQTKAEADELGIGRSGFDHLHCAIGWSGFWFRLNNLV
jgi:hypothetical protein